MNGWTLPFDSDVLLTIGWGVLMTAAIGIVAAVVTWASQFVLPAAPARRRAWFVLAVLVGSLALAWTGPAAELLRHAAQVIPAPEAMGVPPATVPGSMVSASPPIGPASALCRTDEPDSHTSPGGIVAIRGEPGRFAKCVNGGWTEVAADESAASDVVRLQFDLRRDGILFGSPAVMVQNDRTATLSVDHGASRIAVTPRRVGESVALPS